MHEGLSRLLLNDKALDLGLVPHSAGSRISCLLTGALVGNEGMYHTRTI